MNDDLRCLMSLRITVNVEQLTISVRYIIRKARAMECTSLALCS